MKAVTLTVPTTEIKLEQNLNETVLKLSCFISVVVSVLFQLCGEFYETKGALIQTQGFLE